MQRRDGQHAQPLSAAQLAQFFHRIGVEEGAGIGKANLGAAGLVQPAVYFSSAARQVGGQILTEGFVQKTKHRLALRLAALQRYGHRGARTGTAIQQSGDEIQGEPWRIARRRHQPFGGAVRQTGEEARQRARIARLGIRPYRCAEFRIALQIPVGIDGEEARLRLQPLDRMLHKRRAFEKLQSLVHTAHATAAAACQHETRHLRISSVHVQLP